MNSNLPLNNFNFLHQFDYIPSDPIQDLPRSPSNKGEKPGIYEKKYFDISQNPTLGGPLTAKTNHPSIKILMKWGMKLRDNGNYYTAIQQYRAAVIFMLTLNTDWQHHDGAVCYLNMATMFRQIGNYPLAAKLLENAGYHFAELKVYEGIRACFHELTDIMLALKKYEEMQMCSKESHLLEPRWIRSGSVIAKAKAYELPTSDKSVNVKRPNPYKQHNIWDSEGPYKYLRIVKAGQPQKEQATPVKVKLLDAANDAVTLYNSAAIALYYESADIASVQPIFNLAARKTEQEYLANVAKELLRIGLDQPAFNAYELAAQPLDLAKTLAFANEIATSFSSTQLTHKKTQLREAIKKVLNGILSKANLLEPKHYAQISRLFKRINRPQLAFNYLCKSLAAIDTTELTNNANQELVNDYLLLLNNVVVARHVKARVIKEYAGINPNLNAPNTLNTTCPFLGKKFYANSMVFAMRYGNNQLVLINASLLPDFATGKLTMMPNTQAPLIFPPLQ
jgi:hypothetical protein